MNKPQSQFNGDKGRRELGRKYVAWRVDEEVCLEIKQSELTDLFKIVCALPKTEVRQFCRVLARRPVAPGMVNPSNITREFVC